MKDWKIYQLQNVVDVSQIKEDPIISDIGKRFIYRKNNLARIENEDGVSGSITRYNYPKYKDIFYYVKSVVETVIGERLYPTYYFDRFYFSETYLKKHIDRPSCEISVSMNISNTTGVDWPISFEHDGEIYDFTCDPGDCVLYKGMELPHWRNKLICPEGSYYHQIFFHYVRADGYYLQYAYDRI